MKQKTANGKSPDLTPKFTQVSSGSIRETSHLSRSPFPYALPSPEQLSLPAPGVFLHYCLSPSLRFKLNLPEILRSESPSSRSHSPGEFLTRTSPALTLSLGDFARLGVRILRAKAVLILTYALGSWCVQQHCQMKKDYLWGCLI